MKKHCRHLVLLILALSLFLSSVGRIAMAVDAEGGQDGSERDQSWLRTPITYSCVNEPIETVLMELAEKAGVDIVKSPKVTGTVTVKLTEVPLEEALTNILGAYDYTYIATENMIRVVALPEFTAIKEPLETRIYRITYADANQVAKALSGYVSEKGKVALNMGTSHVIVTDVESKIKNIDKFIKQIDSITPQILVEVRIYDITTNEGFDIDTAWSAGRNTPLRTTEHTNIRNDTDHPTSMTQTTTYNEFRTDTTDSTENTDGHYQDSDDGYGFMNTVTGITQTKDEDSTTNTTTDIPFATRTNTATETFVTRRRKPFVGGSYDRLTGGTLNFSLLNDAIDLDFMLNILSRQTEAKLLANPRILVLDNETANFEIVREIPYRELMQVAREDPITFTDFKNVGVQLKVTPHIARDGMIRLHIAPEFGILVGYNPDGAPTVDARRADTTTMIRDGQTVAIGGLRKRETSKEVSKVPLLGDIPLLGGLFRSESESEQVNELVVFITTRIVHEPVLSDIERQQYILSRVAPADLENIEAERELTERLLQSLSK